jgi:hypothetical protein
VLVLKRTLPTCPPPRQDTLPPATATHPPCTNTRCVRSSAHTTFASPPRAATNAGEGGRAGSSGGRDGSRNEEAQVDTQPHPRTAQVSQHPPFSSFPFPSSQPSHLTHAALRQSFKPVAPIATLAAMLPLLMPHHSCPPTVSPTLRPLHSHHSTQQKPWP